MAEVEVGIKCKVVTLASDHMILYIEIESNQNVDKEYMLYSMAAIIICFLFWQRQ